MRKYTEKIVHKYTSRISKMKSFQALILYTWPAAFKVLVFIKTEIHNKLENNTQM